MRILARTLFAFKPCVRLKSTNTEGSFEYCLNLVRNHDYENYLSTLLLSKEHARRAFALRAFNIEIANVESHAKEDALVQMRLKFWQDAVEKIFSDNPPDHPVAREVHKALRKNPLIKKNAMSKSYLHQLVKSRTTKISSSTFQSIYEMEQYAERSTSPIYYLQLLSCGIQDVKADHAFSHLGKGQGVTNLLRSVPYHAQRGAVILPQDALVKHKVSHEAVTRGRGSEPLKQIVFEVASCAHAHLGKAQSMIVEVNHVMHKHFLPIFPSMSYLERLHHVDFDVFHPSLQLRDNKLPLKLLWRSWLGRVGM